MPTKNITKKGSVYFVEKLSKFGGVKRQNAVLGSVEQNCVGAIFDFLSPMVHNVTDNFYT